MGSTTSREVLDFAHRNFSDWKVSQSRGTIRFEKTWQEDPDWGGGIEREFLDEDLAMREASDFAQQLRARFGDRITVSDPDGVSMDTYLELFVKVTFGDGSEALREKEPVAPVMPSRVRHTLKLSYNTSRDGRLKALHLTLGLYEDLNVPVELQKEAVAMFEKEIMAHIKDLHVAAEQAGYPIYRKRGIRNFQSEILRYVTPGSREEQYAMSWVSIKGLRAKEVREIVRDVAAHMKRRVRNFNLRIEES